MNSETTGFGIFEKFLLWSPKMGRHPFLGGGGGTASSRPGRPSPQTPFTGLPDRPAPYESQKAYIKYEEYTA